MANFGLTAMQERQWVNEGRALGSEEENLGQRYEQVRRAEQGREKHVSQGSEWGRTSLIV